MILGSLPRLTSAGFPRKLVVTSRQYFAFNGFPVVEILVAETHRGRHDIVLRPFPQGLIVETKPLLYQFCTFVCAALQYNGIFHVFLDLLKTRGTTLCLLTIAQLLCPHLYLGIYPDPR